MSIKPAMPAVRTRWQWRLSGVTFSAKIKTCACMWKQLWKAAMHTEVSIVSVSDLVLPRHQEKYGWQAQPYVKLCDIILWNTECERVFLVVWWSWYGWYIAVQHHLNLWTALPHNSRSQIDSPLIFVDKKGRLFSIISFPDQTILLWLFLRNLARYHSTTRGGKFYSHSSINLKVRCHLYMWCIFFCVRDLIFGS